MISLTGRRRRSFHMLAALCIGVSGCSDDAIPVLQEQRRDAPKMDVSRDLALAGTACVVVYAKTGAIGFMLSISREHLPFTLPELSTAEASRETGRSFSDSRVTNCLRPTQAAHA